MRLQAIALCLASASTMGEAVTLEFEDLVPFVGTQSETQVFEGGFRVGGEFGAVAAQFESSLAWNGTGLLTLGQRDSVRVVRAGGGRFDAIGIDLAEFSTVTLQSGTQPQLVVFSARQDGRTVARQFMELDLVIDGPAGTADFQTFLFDPDFSQIDELFIETTLVSLDNLVLSEPRCICDISSGVFFGVTLGDLVTYLDWWFVGDARADLDGGGVSIADLLVFLECWLAPDHCS